MKIDWKGFKTDRYFFLKYFSLELIGVSALFAALYAWKGPLAMELQLTWKHLLLLPLAFILGVKLPVALHNAVHGNFRPRALNEGLGILGGFFVLFGFAPFRISHILHHAFADTEFDPHPPEGKGFTHFLTTTQINSILVIRRKFLAFHGDNLMTHTILVTEMAIYYAGIAARVACWLWILGPTLMVALFFPALAINIVTFAHINFATHVKKADGTYEMLNLNENWYHKMVNFIGDGAYFHKNHHEQPRLINPRYAHAR